MAYPPRDSKREILSEALHKANNAVFFDDRGNYLDAIRAYGDSCALLGQVMRTTLENVDREKVEAIVSPGPGENMSTWLTRLRRESPIYGASTNFEEA